MTYILGARCIDGVVLISDTKTFHGQTTYHKEKLIPVLNNVIIGCSGSCGLIYMLSDKIKEWWKKYNQIADWDMVLEFIEDESLKLSQRYDERDVSVSLLMSIRPSKIAKLYNIVTHNGFVEPVKECISFGSGESYGAFLLKYLWDKDMTMMDFGKLGYFLIKYVEGFELDKTVGGEPIIWFIPDIQEEVNNDEEYEKVKVKYESRPANKDEIKDMKLYSNQQIDRITNSIIIMRGDQSVSDIKNEKFK